MEEYPLDAVQIMAGKLPMKKRYRYTAWPSKNFLDTCGVTYEEKNSVRVTKYESDLLQVAAVLDYDMPEKNLDLYGGGSRKAYELSINDFDFRFFPYFGNHIEFYFWGKYAGKIYFINQGQHPLRVKTPCGEFMLPADQKAYRIKPDANAPWYEKY